MLTTAILTEHSRMTLSKAAMRGAVEGLRKPDGKHVGAYAVMFVAYAHDRELGEARARDAYRLGELVVFGKILT